MDHLAADLFLKGNTETSRTGITRPCKWTISAQAVCDTPGTTDFTGGRDGQPLERSAMPHSPLFRLSSLIFATTVAAVSGIAVHAQSVASDESPFLAENAAAMDRMMTDMAVKPTGDVDVDFAAMMIPHHQGAIDMALAQLRYGKNEQLRRIAQEIIVEQQQEIIAMRVALGQKLPPPGTCPNASAAQPAYC
jgi:hypothetical protein